MKIRDQEDDRFMTDLGETNFSICGTKVRKSCPKLYQVANRLLNCSNLSKNELKKGTIFSNKISRDERAEKQNGI